LVDAGRPRSTPAAIVQWAWTEDQRTIAGSLADLPTLAAAANIGPPATLVVGDVVAVTSGRVPGAVDGVEEGLGRTPRS
jgi:siroheme synthase